MDRPTTTWRRISFALNLRLSRSLRISRANAELFAEVFNLTNRENVLGLNGGFGAGAFPTNPAPTFRQITAVGEPRAVQLGVRVGY